MVRAHGGGGGGAGGKLKGVFSPPPALSHQSAPTQHFIESRLVRRGRDVLGPTPEHKVTRLCYPQGRS